MALSCTRGALFHRMPMPSAFHRIMPLPLLARCRMPHFLHDIEIEHQAPMRITNSSTQFRFEMEVPRFKASEINVQVKKGNGDVLCVQGDAKSAMQPPADPTADIVLDTFSELPKLDSRLPLPEGLDLGKMETVVEEGVLRVTIPYSAQVLEERRQQELLKNWPPRFTEETRDGKKQFVLHLPGFRKEQLGVQLVSPGLLSVDVSVGSKKRQVSIQVPRTSTQEDIQAAYKDDKLTITVRQPSSGSSSSITIH